MKILKKNKTELSQSTESSPLCFPYYWKLVYLVWPPILRCLERLQFHHERQNFLIGKLRETISTQELQNYLTHVGYTPAILAWKDPGEILSVRKVDDFIFQYHIRVFSDREVRAHYEYASEGNPWGHITESVFEDRRAYFEALLKDFLVPHRASERNSQNVAL